MMPPPPTADVQVLTGHTRPSTRDASQRGLGSPATGFGSSSRASFRIDGHWHNWGRVRSSRGCRPRGSAGRSGAGCRCHPGAHDNGGEAGVAGNAADPGACRGGPANGTDAASAVPRRTDAATTGWRPGGLAAWPLGLHRRRRQSLGLARRPLCAATPGRNDLGAQAVVTYVERFVGLDRGPLGLAGHRRAVDRCEPGHR